MKNKLAAIALTSISFSTLPALADTEGYVEVLTASSYVWRGDLYSEDLFDPNFQSLAEIKAGPLSAGFLGYFPTKGNAHEIDPRIGYTVYPTKQLELKTGYTAYVLLDPVDDYMHEFSLDISAYNSRLIYPIAGIAVDPIKTNGAYAYSGLASSFGKIPTVGIKLTGGISGYDGVELGAQDLTLNSTVYVPLGKTFTIGVVGALSYAVRTDDVNPWAGIALGAGF